MCRLEESATYAILEIGMNKAGEISLLTELVQPNIAAIINIHTMHMENFACFQDIAFAKSEIFKGLRALKGEKSVVINADSPFFEEVLITEAKKYQPTNIISFGKNGNIALSDFSVKENKTLVNISIDKECFSFYVNGVDERFVYNSIFCVAVLKLLNLDIQRGISSISSFSPLKGRGKVFDLTLSNKVHIMLIDDSYSAQPEALRQAISSLSLLDKKFGRKIAIIGQMAEIGEQTIKEHQSIGKLISGTDIDCVIGIGEKTKEILKYLPLHIEKIFKADIEGFFEDLKNNILRNGDIVLIKGSHYSSGVFEIVEQLLSDSSQENL